MSQRIMAARPFAALMIGALVLMACGVSNTVVQNGPTATPTAAPKPTTCAQLPGLASATPLTLPNMEFPAGTVAAAPVMSFGGVGQYTFRDYSACAPNNTTDLIVSTGGKGPEPFTRLLGFYGWATWPSIPGNGSALSSCPGSQCFAFNVDSPSKATFGGPPRFLSLEHVLDNGNALISFHLRVALPPAEPACDPGFDTFDDSVYGHHPEYVTATGYGAIQWPPLTRMQGDSAPSIVGSDQCSAGTAASVKAFMDDQFSSQGATAVACAQDCWSYNGVTYTMSITSATSWTFSYPRTFP